MSIPDYSLPPEKRPWPCSTYGSDHICADCTTAGRGEAWVRFEPHFSEGLGAWVETPGDVRRIAREKGLEEVSLRELKEGFVPNRTPEESYESRKARGVEEIKRIMHRLEHDASYRERQEEDRRERSGRERAY